MNQGTSIVCSERASLRASVHSVVKTSAHVFVVPGNAAGTRLDIWLTQQVLACQAITLSRARLQALIHDGHVTVNGRMTKEHHKISTGDSIKLVIPPPVATALIPEAIPLDILYEDADLLVINKPAGLVVHPAAGHSLRNPWLTPCCITAEVWPAIGGDSGRVLSIAWTATPAGSWWWPRAIAR